MERSGGYKVKSWFKRVFFKTKRIFKMGGRVERHRRPKNLNESQNIAVDITVKTILNATSILSYDPETHECYIEGSNGTLFIFIESRNIKIINTVFGYDIPISIPTENYVTYVFRREVTKRRMKFKKAALDKIEFSLQKALNRISRELKK